MSASFATQVKIQKSNLLVTKFIKELQQVKDIMGLTKEG